MYINSSPHHTSITFRVGGEPCKMTKGKREMILTRNSTTKLFSKLSRSTRQSSGRVHAGRTCLCNSSTTPTTDQTLTTATEKTETTKPARTILVRV